MSPNLTELFRSLRSEVCRGYEEGKIDQEVSENLLHDIYAIEAVLNREKTAEDVFRETLINRLGGMRNEIHELNKTLEKHLKRK